VVWDRARGGAYASITLAGSGVFAVFLFLTYYMQQNLGFSPLTTGVAFLPMTATIVITSTTVQTKVLARTSAKLLVAGGMIIGTVAMILFTRLAPGSSYASHLLPGLILIGFGMGCIVAPAFSTATLGVDGHEAGIASAMVNTSRQVGGSVGTALLSTLFASAAASYAASHVHPPRSSRRGADLRLHDRLLVGSRIFAIGLLVLPGRIKPRVAIAEPSPGGGLTPARLDPRSRLPQPEHRMVRRDLP